MKPMSYFSKFASGYVLTDTKDGSTMVCLSHFNLQFFVLFRHLSEKAQENHFHSHILLADVWSKKIIYGSSIQLYEEEVASPNSIEAYLSVDGSP